MKKYVLIGGSIATEGAIEGILSVTKNADITVICGEKRRCFSSQQYSGEARRCQPLSSNGAKNGLTRLCAA